MTKFFIVHAHHEPKSFNGALTATAKETLEAAGHEVKVTYLYQDQFDPVSDRRNFTTVKDPEYLKQQLEELHAKANNGFAVDIQAELDKLLWCDVLIFQFPLWWFGLPAVLKGWVDRVFVMGTIYGEGRYYNTGVLSGKKAFLSVSTGGPATSFSQHGLNGDINAVLYPIHHGILYFTGFTVLPPFLVWSPARISDEERQKYLEDYKHRLLNLDELTPIAYHPLEHYDERLILKSEYID